MTLDREPASAPPDIPTAPTESSGGCLRWAGGFLLVSIGAILLAVAIIAFGLYQQGERFISRAEELFQQPQPTPVIDTRAIIVEQLNGASELTTAKFVMETVVSQAQDRTIGPFTVGQTKLLYVAYGEARAGVNLDEITADDVTVVSDTVTIALPPPKLLDTSIDVDRSYVYDLQRSLLGPVDPELQSRAERFARNKIEETACESDILGEANRNAEIAVRSLLRAAGFAEVNVETQPPAPDECPPGAGAD